MRERVARDGQRVPDSSDGEHPSPDMCMVMTSFWPVVGGAETQARVQAREFSARSVGVTVITRRVRQELPREERRFGARILRIPPNGSLPYAQYLSLFPIFWRLLRERREYDIIFVSGFRTAGVPAVLAGKLTGKKVICRPQNTGELSGAFFDAGLRRLGLDHDHWLVRPLLAVRNFILRRADAYCPTSTDMEREFLEQGVPEQKVHRIPNAYEEDRFRPASHREKEELRARMGIDPDRMVVVFTGRLVSWKGPQKLVEVWRDLTRHETRPLLLLVGPPGNDMFDCSEDVRRAIADHGLEEWVRLTGGVDNVEDYLRLSDLYVFFSQGDEGLPNAMIEAMACGLPVVSTRTPGVRDLVDDRSGILVDPSATREFRQAVERLLEDPDLRSSMGRSAAERAERLYAPRSVIPRYLELFRSLVNSASGAW